MLGGRHRREAVRGRGGAFELAWRGPEASSHSGVTHWYDLDLVSHWRQAADFHGARRLRVLARVLTCVAADDSATPKTQGETRFDRQQVLSVKGVNNTFPHNITTGLT